MMSESVVKKMELSEVVGVRFETGFVSSAPLDASTESEY